MPLIPYCSVDCLISSCGAVKVWIPVFWWWHVETYCMLWLIKALTRHMKSFCRCWAARMVHIERVSFLSRGWFLARCYLLSCWCVKFMLSYTSLKCLDDNHLVTYSPCYDAYWAHPVTRPLYECVLSLSCGFQCFDDNNMCWLTVVLQVNPYTTHTFSLWFCFFYCIIFCLFSVSFITLLVIVGFV